MTLKEWLEELKAETAMFPPKKRRGTQQWLAKKMRVDQGLVSRWVNRRSTPTWDNAIRLCRLSSARVTLAELERVK